MADVSKAQKLASARKKFKELKREKQKNVTPKPNEESESSRSQTPIETNETATETPIANYFNDDVKHDPQEAATTFFDTLSLEKPKISGIEEGLREISAQIAEIINTTGSETEETEFDSHDHEGSSLLIEEKHKNEALNQALHEHKMELAQLQSQLHEIHLNSDLKIQNEISSLKEQLQYHVQTVGILVGEKTELVASLNQYQTATKLKNDECSELQGRLSASRSRVAELEREMALLKNDRTQSDSLRSDFNKLQHDLEESQKEKEDTEQDLLELREKLRGSSESNLIFQQQIAELSNQLSLANIKIQQLNSGVSGNGDLIQEKFKLEQEISELNLMLKQITKEREESNLQYQQYAQQLNAQLGNLAGRLEKLQKENETLQVQEQTRIKHIGELEKQLQSLQESQVAIVTDKTLSATRDELETAFDLIEKLKAENSELRDENLAILNDTQSKVARIKELEAFLEEQRSTQPDSVKLLATMESDKIAAARAIAQNHELKKQLESMQEVFEKSNEDKVALTESLTIEQDNVKNLFEKLQKTELHLQTLTEAIEIKDKELCHLRNDSVEMDKEWLNSEQLHDRLRHYEAQDHGNSSLQAELQQANLMISKLNEEIRRDKTDSNHNSFLDQDSAMKQLEEKVLRTMSDIAVLNEEKQRLEHLVLQLQGETETIGEYVALYQQQRSLLKQKAVEKDQQLTQLANDRELLKNKLDKLNELVKKLVVENGTVNSEINEIAQNTIDGDETAEEIITLLSEIKSSNLVQPSENFHHCHCCSGHLITV